MTTSTGKRSYRACQRCRSRKTRCDLDSIGTPKSPPCVSCHRSGSECIFGHSRRGGCFRVYRGPDRISQSYDNLHSAPVHSTATAAGPQEAPSTISDCEGYHRSTNDSNQDLCAELRNPSDALLILARSSEAYQDDSFEESPYENRNYAADSVHGAYNEVLISGLPAKSLLPEKLSIRSLDHFDLIQKGLINTHDVVELFSIFLRKYHVYCPIVPILLLEQPESQDYGEADYFLLSVILTVASRDQPDHFEAHRLCWGHTQGLLLDVVLALSWTQKTQIICGLLLLAEWLPQLQTDPKSNHEPQSLFSESRTAWSMIGMAIRHAYLLRLDHAAFRKYGHHEMEEVGDQARLIWTPDRQISVRLGQAFWSRGPSLSSNFTARDFPSLERLSEKEGENYAQILHAMAELTQLLHNVQDVLYSSQERTLSLVFAGDYPRYLEDFQRAAERWYASWNHKLATSRIRHSVLILYEYLQLYVNAFSFQAVLTRLSQARRVANDKQQRKPSSQQPFPGGIMASPDGRWVYDAINAAMKILNIINNLDPEEEKLRYLPSRYYVYGVYAAVFLYKVVMLGLCSATSQKQEIYSLAGKFITAMDKAASNDSHLGRIYSRMLTKLWLHSDRNMTPIYTSSLPGTARAHVNMAGNSNTVPDISPVMPLQERNVNDDFDRLTDVNIGAVFDGAYFQGEPHSLSVDAELFGPFIPLSSFHGGLDPCESLHAQFSLGSDSLLMGGSHDLY